MAGRVLVVDDDPVARRLVETMVERCGYQPFSATDGDDALALLTRRGAPAIDAIVLDLVMPGLDGMGVLRRLRTLGLSIPVIVQASPGGVDAAAAAIRAGAQDFVLKPVGIERLEVSLRNAMAAHALTREVQRLRHHNADTLTFADLDAHSDAMVAAVRLGLRAAASDSPVLLEGEAGVGKATIARAIHGSGERRLGRFVAVRCSALDGAMLDDALFGPSGKIVEADRGTLFLQDIDALPPPAQDKLLHLVQDGLVATGGRPLKVDVRVISATRQNLLACVKAGSFRDDLFYRLHVLPITAPPLRTRQADLPYIVRRLVARIAAEEDRPVHSVTAEAMARLHAFSWPGNLRQLQHALYRAVVATDGAMLDVHDFPAVSGVPAIGPVPGAPILFDPPRRTLRIVGGDIPIVPQATPRDDDRSLPLLTADGEIRPLDEMEAQIIRFAVSHYRGQMSKAARRLGIGRSTLYRKLEGTADGSSILPS